MAGRDESETKTPITSKQLLYSERFGEIHLEDRLKIIGERKKGNLGKPCLPPPSAVLSRMKELIPKLAAANEELKTRPQSEVDIEHVEEDYSGPLIEMNLALMPKLGPGMADESSEEEEESDDDSDSDDDADISPSTTDSIHIGANDRSKAKKRKLVCELDDQLEETHSEEGK